MSKRNNLSSDELFYMTHECRHVVGPLRPGIDVPSLSITLAVTPEVERIRAHSMAGHRFRETRVTARVLAEPVHHCKRGVRVRSRPCPVGELCSISRPD